MNKNGTIMIQDSAQLPRAVAWLRVGGTYQIRTNCALFQLAVVKSKRDGAVEIEYYGASHDKRLYRPSTPLYKALAPVRQRTTLPIVKILSAREVTG